MALPVAGAYLWLNVDDPLHVTASAGLVSSVNDQGSGNNDFAQATDANKPGIGTRSVFGRAALNFDGTTDYIQTAGGPTLTGPSTVFWALKLDDSAGLHQIGFGPSAAMPSLYTNAGVYVPGSPATEVGVGTPDANDHVLTIVMNGASSVFRVDGVVVSTANFGAGSASGVNPFAIGSNINGTGLFCPMAFTEVAVFDSALVTADLEAMENYLRRPADSYRIAAVQPAFWGRQGFVTGKDLPFQLRGAEAAQEIVSGTSATTNADDTSAATGAYGPSGTLARTNANDTSAAAGSTVTGSLARTNANDTSAATGGFGPSGTLARTNANDTSAAAGSTVTGSLARTNANDTSAASGAHGVAGTLARTNANDTSAATGGTGAAGTLARTNANDTVVASGSSVTGSLARTNANDTSVATGAAGGAAGISSTTNANDTGVGVGAFGSDVVGTSSTTNANDTVVAAGSTVTGSSTTTNANDLIDASGTAGEVLPPTVVESQPGGRANYTPSPETREYWEKERQRLAADTGLDAILADDEEILVML